MTDGVALRAARLARLRAAMAEAGQDALVLTAAGAVRYASGAVPLHGDSSLEAARPFAAVVTARALHVLGVEPAFVSAAVPAHVLPRAPREAAAMLLECVGDARRIGVDRLPFAVAAALGGARPQATIEAAERTVLAARAVKTAEELALLAEAQRLAEAAMAELLPAIVPGLTEVELAGRFLAAMAERGVTACHVEPLFCVLPRRAAEAPWTFAGGLPYRELPGERVLAAGDQVMIDTGMLHGGYMSDFGCTWVCGGEPAAADLRLRMRWQAIVDAVLAACRPGATAADLHRAAEAADGPGRPAPWPRPLYLAHGIGLGGVEPPFIGTDLGLAVEEGITLAPGMVLVLEPYVWEEGAGGYRAEQTIAITETGYELLSAPPP
jgi:Xaa-Pro aminopeptidase